MLPFDESRRLFGPNLFFGQAGAVLEVNGAGVDAALIGAWRERVGRAAALLGWPAPACVARRHAGGVSLACSAPPDQLFTATEVNEWAVAAALVQRDPAAWSRLEQDWIEAATQAAADLPDPAQFLAPMVDEAAAMARLARLAAAETRPGLRTLLSAADERSLPCILDEQRLTLGSGCGGHDYPLASLPPPAQVDWQALRGVPTALVTGSNGKTTTVRLVAACLRASGLHATYNCTDGVFHDGEALCSGDYSGPVGTRTVLRERRTEAAVLEVARGGILRRGIAVSRADAAIVTNVSADHFGEYGIDDLAGLADAKLSVASVVPDDGLLILNAEDAVLCERSLQVRRRFGGSPPCGWFAAGADGAALARHRSSGAPACGLQAGRLVLSHAGARHDLGEVARMPLAIDGVARYNVANLAGAALVAAALGVAPPAIATAFATFGARPEDNPGRLMRYELHGVTVLVDYAHNPDGLHGLLTVANHLRRAQGRLGLILGHAGNRRDEDIEELARVAADFRPDLVVVKENEKFLRGRLPGEIPRILQAELARRGIGAASMPFVAGGEVSAARHALAWARPGDILALPVHSAEARAAVLALIAAGGAP